MLENGNPSILTQALKCEVSIFDMVKRTRLTDSIAGLILLGSSLGVRIGQAAQEYASKIPNAEELAQEYREIFEKELVSEVQKRKNDLANAKQMYLLDCMLEELVGDPFDAFRDSTPQGYKETEKFVTDVYRCALKNSLKQMQIYKEVKTGLKNRFKFSINPGEGTARADYKAGLGENYVIRANDVTTGLKTSLSDGELGISAYLGLSNINLFGKIGIGSARLEAGSRGLKACLESAISSEILENAHASLSAEFKDFEDTGLQLGLTSRSLKDDQWLELTLGCRKRETGSETYAGAHYALRF